MLFYSLVIIAVGLVLKPDAIAASQTGTGLVTADAMAVAFKTSVMAKVIIVGGMCGIITSWNSFMTVSYTHLYRGNRTGTEPDETSGRYDARRSAGRKPVW